MKKFIRKADIILFIALIVIGLACSIYLSMSKSSGNTVVIKRDGKLYAEYSLFEDRELVISDSGKASVKANHSDADASDTAENVLVINNGSVYMKSATCHNQVCVHHEKISRAGESIVCLPNKVVVTIEGEQGEGGGYDAVSK